MLVKRLNIALLIQYPTYYGTQVNICVKIVQLFMEVPLCEPSKTAKHTLVFYTINIIKDIILCNQPNDTKTGFICTLF